MVNIHGSFIGVVIEKLIFDRHHDGGATALGLAGGGHLHGGGGELHQWVGYEEIN